MPAFPTCFMPGCDRLGDILAPLKTATPRTRRHYASLSLTRRTWPTGLRDAQEMDDATCLCGA